jgi:hypothetical protein
LPRSGQRVRSARFAAESHSPTGSRPGTPWAAAAPRAVVLLRRGEAQGALYKTWSVHYQWLRLRAYLLNPGE